jgi:hypothetical protein
MNRRRFIRAFAGAVATVAIGMRMASPMPRLDFNEENVEAIAIKYKATMRVSGWNNYDWRAVYGTPSGLDGVYEQA